MNDYKYITGDKAIIVTNIANHPYELKTEVTVLGQAENSNWKVTDGTQECVVTSVDLFPSYEY